MCIVFVVCIIIKRDWDLWLGYCSVNNLPKAHEHITGFLEAFFVMGGCIGGVCNICFLEFPFRWLSFAIQLSRATTPDFPDPVSLFYLSPD